MLKMSVEEDSYCRLCAEPTPKTQLIDPDDDVGLNSKIATKMSWINIDISTENNLPNAICFSCFDLLERTWSFLHNVRTAQTKLNEIFSQKSDGRNTPSDIKSEPDISVESIQNNCNENTASNAKSDVDITGKPVNQDWEIFEDLKHEVKPEISNDELQIMTVDPSTLIDLDAVKTESHSDDYIPESDGCITSDSDAPLYLTTKKKNKKKTKLKENTKNDILNDSDDLNSQTWADCMCLCADCDAQCKNIMSLRLHSLQIHTRCCLFKCSDCGKVISNNKSFINHVRTHKKGLRYCCEYCNKRFMNYTYLKSHHSKIHKENHDTTCHNCGSNFENIEQLHDHIVLYSRKLKRRPMKSEKHDFSEDLKCEHCSKEFKSRSNLQQHKVIHMERSRDFSCHICGKMFFTKGTLSTHMMTHDETKPFKCEFCPLTFRARGNLQSHISLHSGAKPFVCEQCGKSFRVKRHLKSHSIIHTDLMPYECNYCNKTFRFKTRLNLHLRQHTGAKPYKCIYCQRDFTNGSNYKKHMRRKHNIDTSRQKYSNIVTNRSLEKSDIERSQT